MQNKNNCYNSINLNTKSMKSKRKCVKTNLIKCVNNFYSIEQFLHFQATGRKPHPKVKFTPKEDDILRELVQKYGETDNWTIIANNMTIIIRNVRQCKERWFNYLSPSINKKPFTDEEDEKLEKLYAQYGAKWVKIAKFFPSRTEIFVKSRWNRLQRRKNKADLKKPIENNKSTIVTNQEQNQSLYSLEEQKTPTSINQHSFFENESIFTINNSFDENIIESPISNDQIANDFENIDICSFANENDWLSFFFV